MAIVMEVNKTKLRLSSDANTILRLRPMENKNKLAALHILNTLMPYTYQAGSFFNPLLGTRIVRLSLKHGLHKNCALGFCTLGWVLCGNDRKMGYRLGRIALTIIEGALAKELIPRVHMFFYGFVHHWRRPLRESLDHLQNAAQVGLESGDMEYAYQAPIFKCSHSTACGVPMTETEKMLIDTIQLIQVHKQSNIVMVAKIMLQFLDNMTGRSPDPTVLAGEVIDADTFSTEAVPSTVQVAWYGIGANVAFRFGDYEVANQLTEKRRQMAFEPNALFSFVVLRQTEALLAVARARQGINRRKGYRFGRKCFLQMKAWAADCPENFRCRMYFLEAELRSLNGIKCDNYSIQHLYDLGIEDALKQG